MRITLTPLDTPGPAKFYDTTSRLVLCVGRDKSAELIVPADRKHVSRRHFQIELDPPVCKLRLVARDNILLVNGRRVTGEVILTGGDIIDAAGVRFRVVIDQNAVGAVMPGEDPLVWQQGHFRPGEPIVESTLARWPELAAKSDRVLQLIYHEFVMRLSYGERVTPETYAGRFPELGDLIARQLALHEHLLPTPTEL